MFQLHFQRLRFGFFSLCQVADGDDSRQLAFVRDGFALDFQRENGTVFADTPDFIRLFGICLHVFDRQRA